MSLLEWLLLQPLSLGRCAAILICLRIRFYFPFWFLLCPVDGVGVCHSSATCCKMSTFSPFKKFYFYSTVIRKDTWCDFYLLKFVETRSVFYCVVHYAEYKYELEKNVRSAAWGRNVLSVSVRSCWSKVPFKSNTSLLIFRLDALSVVRSRVLKSLLFSHCSLFSPSDPLTFVYIYLGAPVAGPCVCTTALSSWCLYPFIAL